MAFVPLGKPSQPHPPEMKPLFPTLLISAAALAASSSASAQVQFSQVNFDRNNLRNTLQKISKQVATSKTDTGRSNEKISITVPTKPQPIRKVTPPRTGTPKITPRPAPKITIPSKQITYPKLTPNPKLTPTPKITPTPKPAPVNTSQMISILKGKSTPSMKTSPSITNRITKVSPGVMPKGYETFRMKQGRETASGEAISSTTLQMKRGRDRAEGSAVATRIKDDRPMANGSAGPSGHGSNLIDHHSSHPGAHSAIPPQIEYQVDSSSQLSTSSVRFRKGSTDLADDVSYHYLLNLASALQDPSLAGHRFVVEGHASADGSDYANLLLSQRRANAIFDFLVSRGVSPDALLAVGHGEHHARFQSYEPEYLLAQDRQVIVFKLAN